MTDLRKAAEMVLEDFENLASHWSHYAANMDMKRIDFDAIANAKKSLKALRQALAQPDTDLQEAIKKGTKAWAGADPTKWVDELRGDDTKCKDHPDAPHSFDRNASLTEDRYVCECEYWEPPAQPEQEPVSYIHELEDGSFTTVWPRQSPEDKPLYTAPPNPSTDWEAVAADQAMTIAMLRLEKKEWVGLTDEERADCWSSSAVQSAINIEAKLKEKNT
jgi:hypothetical protein